ncbi:nucleotidyltransferase domain-containing protein [Alphaproteobacteria bacterium]|nr:nucleotidyltransferase domain-containing protein [Alphaproteobacteria bacterium]
MKELTKYSSFLKKYEYLEEDFSSKKDFKNILNYYKASISKVIQDSNHTLIGIEKLKNEIIYLIFSSFHEGIINQEFASRLWSLICKNFVTKIFYFYILQSFDRKILKNFFILGLGKIGVKDLNFTSDIDLIIFFDNKNSAIEISDFNKIIKKILSDITNISPSFFHKIDLRLRPDLGGAQIVTDLESAIDYYSSVGRNWERLAYHRSNFLCGNILLYSSFLNTIKSFLFRRSFDFYAIDEIKKLFERKKTSNNLDIKNSYGFIRSCENIIHFNQLLWSGKFNELRESNIHKLFKRISNYKTIINEEDLFIIRDAYYYFRKIENYLHLKQNTFQNFVHEDDPYLKKVSHNYYEELMSKRERVIKIYEDLFSPKNDDQNINIENFNEKSRTIIRKLFEKASNINSSETIRHDYTNSIKYLINLLVHEDQRDELIIKFDYLINYYKSGVHLTGLYKYNSNIFPEIIFIFNNSPKLTNLLNKNNFLIESLVYLFNYGLPSFQIREKSDNFDLDLKKILQDIYEVIFLLDYLYISKKIDYEIYIFKRNRNIKKFLFNLFEIIKTNYTSQKKIFSDLSPILFGSYGINKALPSSDVDLFFIYHSKENNHIDNIKIVRRFYNVINQYVDKEFLIIDDRNKPFDKSSDQVIQFDNFFDFYLKTDEIFHQLSFLKTKILSRSITITRLFNFRKNKIISKYSLIDKNYIKTMFDLKNPKVNFKDLVQLYKISDEIFSFNNEEFSLKGKFKIFNEELVRENLYNSSTKIDLSQSLEELLKIID